jgi:tetratricopeptide (TPR) repeat protein
MPSYRPFVLTIAQPLDGAYPVTAEFQGLLSHESIPVDALRLSLPRPPAVLTPTALRAHERDAGARHFHALFRGEILALFLEAKKWLGPGERLRIVLGEPVPEALAGMPWESIFEGQGDGAAAGRTGAAPLVRYASASGLPHPPPQKGLLRVLMVAGFLPAAGAAAGAEREQALAEIGRGLSAADTLRLVRGHLAEPASLPDLARRFWRGRRYAITLLRHATRDAIADALQSAHAAGEDFHAVHYFGCTQGEDGGELLLEGPDGPPDAVSQADFARLLVGPGVNLLAITLCQEEPAAATVRGVAAEAVRCGASAVLGLRSLALDRSTATFVLEFYRAFAGGEPIEVALAYARRSVRGLEAGPDQLTFPELYVGHTGGLALPSLDRAHVLPLGVRLINVVLALLFTIVGYAGNIFDLADFPRTLRTRMPVLSCIYPWPMDANKLTVAFYPFTVVHEDGSPAAGGAGRALANFLYERFALRFDALDVGLPYEMRSPSAGCAVPGRTAAERARAAADLAERINADILIYGVITDTVKSGRFSLEFNVSYRGFENAQELAGPYALGGPIPVQLPFDPESLLVIENPPHLVRMDVLSNLVVGLSLLSADNPERAVSYFRQAQGNKYWPSIDGKEFAYLLLGHGLLRLASLDNQPELLAPAYDAYTAALTINPAYTRAKLGQANVLAQMALPQAGGAFDAGKADRAKAIYAEALDEATGEGQAQLAAAARAGAGYVCFVRALYTQPGDAERCKPDLEAVIAQYRAGDTRIANQAGLAHGYLAGIARARGDRQAALDEYELAAQLVVPASRARYLVAIGDLRCQLEGMEPALSAYGQAIDEARLYGRAGDVEKYAARMREMQSKGCP